MKNMPIYEALAQAFAAEGVDTHFTRWGWKYDKAELWNTLVSDKW